MHYYMEGHYNPEPKEMDRQEQLGGHFIYSKEFLLTLFFLVFLLILLFYSNTMLGYFVRRLVALIINPFFLLTVFCVIAFSFLAVAESIKESRETIANFNVGAQLYDEVVRPVEFYGQPIALEMMLPRQAFVGEVVYLNQEVIYETGSHSHSVNWETSSGGGGDDYKVGMEQQVPEAVQEVEPVNEVEEEQQVDEAVKAVQVEPSEEAETENSVDTSEDMEENSRSSRTCPIDYIEMEEFNGFIRLYILYRRQRSFQYLEYRVRGYLAMLY
ncbi:hypothetical protein Pint_28334 [Pistacia integerrima]|uniref:Uncharacterized protein n=1 Tax=Pistacia integerrima TaxID=434235 RepID=A0ACC0YNN6_9ROSI|nr:hypothetical protein Pint_28334 [Pistacia integerrima]